MTQHPFPMPRRSQTLYYSAPHRLSAVHPSPRQPVANRPGGWAALASTLLFAMTLGGACSPSAPIHSASTPGAKGPDEPRVTLRAVAVLRPTEGQQARGQVTFTQRKGHVHVAVRLAGLSPGKHGFHIHQLGDCRAADASSAGGHFAPEGNPHGGPTDRARHAGDLGNVVANAEGEVREVIKDPRLVLAGPYSIVGRAVVVHAKADDLESQPAGAAGARVACGVIGKAAQVKRQGN